MSRWYRAYEGTVTDAKLHEIALVVECSRSVVISVWACILESAASANDGGSFDTTPRRVAAILVEPIATIERVFAEMEALGMLQGSSVTAWQRRQFVSDSSTERSRKHRQQKRNSDATLQQQHATPPDTESEKEKEDANASSKKKADKRGTRLSEDWCLPQPDYEWSVSQGFAEHVIGREIDKFLDYWRAQPGQRGVKLDWSATWRNWMRNVQQRAASPPPRSNTRISPLEAAERIKTRERAKAEFDHSAFRRIPADGH